MSLIFRYGFRDNPRLWLQARPKLGERQVNISQVTSWIEKQLCQEFQVIQIRHCLLTLCAHECVCERERARTRSHTHTHTHTRMCAHVFFVSTVKPGSFGHLQYHSEPPNLYQWPVYKNCSTQ